MTIIRSTLAAALLAGLPFMSAHAQTQPTVTLTVTLTLTTPVAPTDTVSAFIGASDKPAEVVLCGTGRGEGRVTPCVAGATIIQRTPIAAGGVTPYRFVRFSGPYGAGQRETTFARGVVTLTRGATITAFYRNLAPATPQRAQLTLVGALGTDPLTLYADGAGFPASRAVTVRLSWQGTPLPRQRPRYTSYTAYQTVRATSQGALSARLSVPARATAFAAFTVRVVATDARTQTTLATVTRTFRTSNGMLTPAPPSAPGSAAGASVFCVNRPATGRVALIPQAGGTPPLARFVVHGLPPRVIIAIFVDQGTDREAYSITRGVLSDATGALVRDVPTFRPPEKTPRRLLLTSFTGTTAVVDASAFPCA